jgi:hypothetical protein
MINQKICTKLFLYGIFIHIYSIESDYYGINNFISSTSFPHINYFDESENKDFIKAKIKCFYIDEYDVYDISSLDSNALDKDGYYSITLKSETSNNSYTIYYNFCNDIKKNPDNCTDGENQAFYKDNEGKCYILGDKINSGNKWSIKNETIYKNTGNETKEVITIDVNSNSNHKLIYKLVCNPTYGKRKKGVFNIMTDNSFIDDTNGLSVTLYVESLDACKIIKFYISSKFIYDYKGVFVILLMGLGALNSFFGKKLSKYNIFPLCIVTITFLIIILSNYVLPSGCAEWIMWVIFAIGIISGGVAGYFAFKYSEKYGTIIIEGIAGFYIAPFLYNWFGNRIHISGIIMNIIFLVVSIGILITLGCFFKKIINIISTSFIGSFCLIRGISLLVTGFPDEIQIFDLISKNEEEQFNEFITWKLYIYLSSMAILISISIYVQFKINKDDVDYNNDINNGDEAPDRLLTKSTMNESKEEIRTYSLLVNSGINESKEEIKITNQTESQSDNNSENQIENKFNESKIKIIFSSCDDQSIKDYGISCYKEDIFSKIKKKLLSKYPDLKNKPIFFIANGNKVAEENSLRDNSIDDGTTILIKICDDIDEMSEE